MALIKTIDEVQKCFKVNGSTSIETILPYIETAQEKYLPKYLGDTLLAALDAWYTTSAPPPANTWYTKLLPYVQKATANFAYFMAADDLNIHSGENGFTVVANSNHVAASEARTKAFKENRERLGYEAIELMLRFLEANKAQFASWTSSPAYTISYKYPINTADELNDCIEVGQSRLVFTKLWPHMDYAVSNNIVGATSQELYDAILAQLKADTVSVANQKLLTPLRQALAFFAWSYKAQAENDNVNRGIYYTKGQNALNFVKHILDNNPTDYPHYTASAQYAAGRTDYKQHTPDTTSGIHVGGTF